MLLAGDEFGHSQGGNNNAYAQDNETTWLDWLGIGMQGQALREFTRRLIEIRKAFPILYRGRFLDGAYNDSLDVKDVTWLSPSGNEMTQAQWDDANARCLGMLLDGRARETGIKRRGSDATVLLVYNAHYDRVNFTLPSVPEGLNWEGLVDTSQPEAPHLSYAFGTVYPVTGRSLVAFALSASPGPRRLRRLREAVEDHE
jgi:glycogen operon protein